MVPLTPPQAPPTWKHTVQDVDKLITEALTKKKKVIGDIVGLPEDKLGFENVSALFHPFRALKTCTLSGLCEFT